MTPFTVVWRHQRENKKKCSLRGLENHPDFRFFSYPTTSLPSIEGYAVLSIEGPPLEKGEVFKGVVVLDATWRYEQKMASRLSDEYPNLVCRRIPDHFRTAYPRKQTACSNPEAGLATVEAIYLAYHILGRETKGILQHYFWKEPFLVQNGLPREEL